MTYYAGLDVSLEQSSVCVVGFDGRIYREGKVSSDPDSLSSWLSKLDVCVDLVGLEAGPLSQWLYAGLEAAGFKVVLLETRHVKSSLSASRVKSDRQDARGIAQLLRMDWYQGVHCKSLDAQTARSLLVSRKLLLTKMLDLQSGIRGILRGFGLKVGRVNRRDFAERVRELVRDHGELSLIVAALLEARAILLRRFEDLDRRMLDVTRGDAVCRQLMTVPGVGAVTALSFRWSIDDPSRFRSSRLVGTYFGLTPRKYQSGEKDVSGRVTKIGDTMVRSTLYEAAHVMLTRVKRPSALKRWAMGVAKRRGHKKATVALARKLAVVMHRMWLDGTEFRYAKSEEAAA